MNLLKSLRWRLIAVVVACLPLCLEAAEPAARVEYEFWKSAQASPDKGAPPAAAKSAPTAADKLLAVEREFWVATRETRNVSDLQAFLQSFPNGAFSKLARARLQQLTRDAPAKNIGNPAPAQEDGLSPAVRGLMDEIKVLRGMVEEMQRTRQATAAPALSRRLTGRALVIGNGDYTHFGKLLNPRNDAEAIAAKLRSFGLQVELLLDADRDGMSRALAEQGRAAVTFDVNILYYAGHAVQLDGENYLLPVNTRADNPSTGYIKLAGVPMAAAIENLPSKTRLIFLDACRDNPLARSIVSTRTTLPKGLAPAESISGTLIAFATKDGSTAEDGSGRNSPYTTALLQYLDNTEDIGIVLRKVRQSVMSATRDRQQPWEYGSLVGDQLVLATMFR